MSLITEFEKEGYKVNIIYENDQPLFRGSDICNAIGISKHNTKLEMLDDDERVIRKVQTKGGLQNTIFVTEPGVYNLVLSGNKNNNPSVRRFKRWVTHELLPNVRRMMIEQLTTQVKSLTLESSQKDTQLAELEVTNHEKDTELETLRESPYKFVATRVLGLTSYPGGRSPLTKQQRRRVNPTWYMFRRKLWVVRPNSACNYRWTQAGLANGLTYFD